MVELRQQQDYVFRAIERGGNVSLRVGEKPASKELLHAFIKAKIAEE